ncbi:hypothetical protein T08_3329 [Trichinella sp. T8]|nr:hypothetical protein T08_3329 [Trichinella sp. T8]
MPSGKRETERQGNTPVNTGPSPNSDGRTYNLVEEADEAARGSGPLHQNINYLTENDITKTLTLPKHASAFLDLRLENSKMAYINGTHRRKLFTKA